VLEISGLSPSVFKQSSKISSNVKATVEFNYNGLVNKEQYGCYLEDNIDSNTYDPENTDSLYDDGKYYQFFDSESGLIQSEYKKRNYLNPISSIFSVNRPDPGIVNLVAHSGASILPARNLKVGNFGNASGGTRLDRIYPMSKSSKFKYWNSVKQVNDGGSLITVGVSQSNGAIENASPFVVYEDSFYVNKIVVKTQKYNGYPLEFKIEYLPHASTTWTTAITVTGSENPDHLSDGKLEIYYNGTSWSTTKSVASQLENPTDSVRIYGLRLSVSKMSTGTVPLEVIEISPRLEIDISDYVMSFDKNSTIEGKVSSIPSAGIISGTGGITLFNESKYFSVGTENSIVSKYLNPGTQVSVWNVVEDVDVPLGVFYAESWNESSDNQISASLEDYFYFLKRQKAPNLMVGNISGVETSVAILMLLDNSGITNYEFIKAYEDSRDDFVMEFFFCSDDQTIMDVLSDIALSAQYSIFIDANNKIKVLTKEAVEANRDIDSTDYWLVGSEDWTESDTESEYLEGEYVSNVISLSEEKIEPITELNIQYAGNGITRQPKAILKTPELLDDTNNAFYNASIISRDLSYVNTELWSIDSADGSENVLLSMPYILDITNIKPQIIHVASNTSPNDNDNLYASSQNDLIRVIYANASANAKKYFEIVLDQERGIEFLQANKFNGYVMINSELIKYNGIVLDVYDPNETNSGRHIAFTAQEANYLKSSSASGVTITVRSILVELVYAPVSNEVDEQNRLSYRFVSDGRGQENTKIQLHEKASENALSTNFRTKLFDSSVSSSIKAKSTMRSESVNPLDPRNPEGEKTYSYPGYLKLSGPKGIASSNRASGISKALSGLSYLPIDNYGERFITGVYKSLEFIPNVISTRMRLISKPDKVQSTKASKKVSPDNRGIAGIGFKLNETANGTTGYFLEIEDIGNITGAQLEKEIYTNMRLYKVKGIVSGEETILTPIIMKTAWVNVNATAQESIDMSSALANGGAKSYASTSDILITITEKQKVYEYRVYWETNLVMTFNEKKSEAINTTSQKVGFMVRHDSVAIFDHLLCLSVSKDNQYSVPSIFEDGESYIKAVEGAERGVLPAVVADASVNNSSLQFSFEDFGNQVREAKRFDVVFDNPSLSASLISLDTLNKEYQVSSFSHNSYGAEFWVFNTSRSSIGLSLETSTPLIISGVALEEINPGEVSLSKYLKNISNDAEEDLLFIKNKYGENAVSFSAKFLNNLSQAENLLEWIWRRVRDEKRAFNVQVFPNPLIEIGDKVRIYDSNIDHTIADCGDRAYYVTSIGYNISNSGISMNLVVEQI
jgi:hypothetical protein